MNDEILKPEMAVTLYNLLQANNYGRVYEAYGENSNNVFLLVKSLDQEHHKSGKGEAGYFCVRFNGFFFETLSDVLPGMGPAEKFFRKAMEENLKKYGPFKVWDNVNNQFW